MASPVGAAPLTVQPSANIASTSSSPAVKTTTSQNSTAITPVAPANSTTATADTDTVFQQQRDKCNRMKGKALDSRRVRFMLDSLKSAGCPIDGDEFVQCDVCEPMISGAMYQKPGTSHIGVLMCQNRLQGASQDYFSTVLTHELVHTFDFCRAHTDFNSHTHHACTEVRAANLSGECTWLREARRGILRFRGHHEECVRRRAVISVLGNPSVQTSEQAKEAVGKVFDRCFRDVQPHGSIPW